MKKFILPILLFLMFIPYIVNAETCDTDSITIENITLEEKSDNVEELEEATAGGKNINLNLSMTEVGDNIKYKIVVKNTSSDDFEIDKNSFNSNSDYIDYSFESDDNSTVVKANSSKTVYLNVLYKKDVSGEEFVLGTYNDKQNMVLRLSNSDFFNPDTNTQSYIIFLIILLLFSGTVFIFLKKKRYQKYVLLVIGFVVIVPISVYALCKSEIVIDSNVVIKSGNRQCSHKPRDAREFVMCEIETDIYDITKKKYDEIINNPNSSEEEVLEAKQLMEEYDYLISQFDWDSYIDKNLNKDNYKNYPDGLYVNNIRAMSFYNEETFNDAYTYNTYIYENNLDWLANKPNWKDSTIKELSGYSFTKVNKNNARLRNIFDPDWFVRTDYSDYRNLDLYIYAPMDLSNFYDGNIIEQLQVNFEIQTMVTKEGDAETEYVEYIEGEWQSNPEGIYQTILNRKVTLINNLVDYYILLRRNNSDRDISFIEDEYNKLDFLLSYGKYVGYVKYTLDEVIDGKTDSKINEILDAFDLDVKQLQLFRDYLEVHKEDPTVEDKIKEYPALKAYLDYLGLDYETGYCQYTYDAETGPDNVPCECVLSDKGFENVKIVYRGKYYEGSDSVYNFMFDYFNINGDDLYSKKQSLYKHLFEITPEP